jgi:hypothetical protein
LRSCGHLGHRVHQQTKRRLPIARRGTERAPNPGGAECDRSNQRQGNGATYRADRARIALPPMPQVLAVPLHSPKRAARGRLNSPTRVPDCELRSTDRSLRGRQQGTQSVLQCPKRFLHHSGSGGPSDRTGRPWVRDTGKWIAHISSHLGKDLDLTQAGGRIKPSKDRESGTERHHGAGSRRQSINSQPHGASRQKLHLSDEVARDGGNPGPLGQCARRMSA